MQLLQGLGVLRSQDKISTLLRTQIRLEYPDQFDAFHPSFPASVEERISFSDSNGRRGSFKHGSGPKASLAVEGSPSEHTSCSCIKVSRISPDSDVQNSSQSYHEHGHSPGSSMAHSGSNSEQQRLNPGTRNGPDLTGDEVNLKPDNHHLRRIFIFSLPTEISDLILAYLSLAALDAARHTCKAWYQAIMSNKFVLVRVLGIDGGLSHREMLKAFDIESNLLLTFQHPDTWRTRFRERRLRFSLPVPTFRYVSAIRTGSQCGFMILQLSTESAKALRRTHSTLVFYRFDSKDFPLYAGFAQHDGTDAAMRINGVTSVGPDTACILEIEIGGVVRLYKITFRKGFSDLERRFNLEALGSPDDALVAKHCPLDVNQIAHIIHSVEHTKKQGKQRWNVLAHFPADQGINHVCFVEDVCKLAKQCLALEVNSGNVFVATDNFHEHPGLVTTGQRLKCDKINIYRVAALLSRPEVDSVFRNAAIASTCTRNGSVRVAVIWQTSNEAPQRSELYLYAIPEAVYYETCRSCDDGLIPEKPLLVVQGKRISSLGPRMGGLHPCSPLWGHVQSSEAALGGLQLPHTTENQENNPRNLQYQKCFVWGPTNTDEEGTEITCRIFDLSFADPQRLRMLVDEGVQSRQTPEGRQHMKSVNSIHCACAPHDDGFRVLVPNTIDTPANMQAADAKISWFWPRKEVFSKSEDSDIGSMTPDDPPARRKALERREDWLRMRIKSMRARALSDFEISEVWGESRWTQYGRVRKPDGWRDL